MSFWETFKAIFTGKRKRRAPAPDAEGASRGPVPRAATTRRERAAGPEPREPRVARGGQDGDDAFVKLAERYLKNKMEDTALHYCMRGLEENPEHLGGRITLVRIYLAKGMLQEAKATLDQLRRERPELSEVRELTEDLERIGVGPVVEAQRVTPKVRRIQTGELQSDTIAEHYIRQNEYEKAIEVYEKLLATKPHNDLIRAKIEEIRVRRSEYEAARPVETPIGASSGADLPAQIQALEAFLDAVRVYRSRQPRI